MALATKFSPELSVVFSLHCVLAWFRKLRIGVKTRNFRFFSVELHSGLFAPSLTCVYHHLEFVGIG